jgi:hypothetical protein
VYLQSSKVGIVLQDNKVYLGPANNGSDGPEPLIMGFQLQEYLSDLSAALSTFASVLGPTFAQPEGTLMETLNSAASGLIDSIDALNIKLDKKVLISKTVYTI